MEKLIYLVAFLGPLVTIPQVTKIWLEKNASGVSLFSWVAYFIGALLWVIYGFFHKEKPIIIAFSFMAILELAVIVGIIMYG